MEQIERIRQMEQILNEGGQVLEALGRALDAYEALAGRLAALDAYYTGPQWQEDRAADEAGQLPQGLRRGVLSEDGIWDLLAARDDLVERMHHLPKPGEEAAREP